MALKNIQGTLDGNWSVDLNEPSTDGILLKGSASISNFAVVKPGAATQPSMQLASMQLAMQASTQSTEPSTQPMEQPSTQPSLVLAINKIDMPDIQVRDGDVRIKPIHLTGAIGDDSAQATAELS